MRAVVSIQPMCVIDASPASSVCGWFGKIDRVGDGSLVAVAESYS